MAKISIKSHPRQLYQKENILNISRPSTFKTRITYLQYVNNYNV